MLISFLLQSITGFAHSSFQFALQKAWPLYMRYIIYSKRPKIFPLLFVEYSNYLAYVLFYCQQIIATVTERLRKCFKNNSETFDY